MLSPVNRPTLIPGLPRVWRGSTELQLGADPARAVVLRLPDPGVAVVLDLLDGSRAERAVLLEAASAGVTPDETRTLLSTLQAARLVLPAGDLLPGGSATGRLVGEAAALALRDTGSPTVAGSRVDPSDTADRPAPAAGITRHGGREVPTRAPARAGSAAAPSADRRPRTPAGVLRRRRAARVLISGRGRLGAGIAVALAEAGVGQVHPDQPGAVQPGELAGGPLRGTDVGRARCEAVSEAVLRAAPGVQAHGVRKTPATLVLQLDHDEPAALLAEAHARRRQPHLAVTIREAAVVVGPLVPAVGGPCLACLELHRRERDAAWPGPGRTDGPEPCAVTTLLAATAYAAAEALTFLDGATPETLGASVEISAPGRVRRRTWPPHPDCDCTRRRRRRAPDG